MRILVIRNEPPWPLCYGGRLRGYELCRRLAERHEVRLLAESGSEEDGASLPFACDVAGEQSGAARPGIVLDRWEEYFGVSPSFVQTVLDTVGSWRPDIVIGMSFRSVSCLARIDGVPVIWDVADDEVLHRIRELNSGRLTGKYDDLKALIATFLYQRGRVSRISACTVVSHTDQRWLRRCTGHHRVECQHNGVDCQYYAPLDLPVDENRLIFWGGLTFGPNVSAILYFAEQVWPLILRQRPQMRWSIIGWGEVPQLERIRGTPGIDLLGYVKDIRHRVAAACISVVPMVSGGGIKNKILEAWAMGRPLLCTPLALGDLPGLHGENVWLARKPRELAEGVLRLASDQELRRRLGRAGRRTVVQDYSWDRAAERLECLCRTLRTGQPCAGNGPASVETACEPPTALLEEEIAHAAS